MANHDSMDYRQFFEEVKKYNRRYISKKNAALYLKHEGDRSLFSQANTLEVLSDKMAHDSLWDPTEEISKPIHTYQNKLYSDNGPVSIGETWSELGFFHTSEKGAEIATLRGGYRESMEDAHIVTKIKIIENGTPTELKLYGIFDGHSGNACARFLAKRVPEYLQEVFSEQCESADLSGEIVFNILRTAFVHLNDEFRKVKMTHRAGSTAVIALIIKEDLWVANVGDSRTIVCDHGKPIALSLDQSPEVPRYREGVEMRGGRVVVRGELPNGTVVYQVSEGSHGLAMARAVGHDERYGITADAEIIKISLEKIQGRIVIMACDGLWDVASSNDVAAAVELWSKNGDSIKVIAEKIVKCAQNAGSMDNITALLFRV